MKRKLSPVEIECLLRAIYLPTADLSDFLNASPARVKATVFLCQEGMISRKDFTITEKGQFWVDHISSIPFPVEKSVWEIPNE